MITRIWHGWTTHENADVYENLLTTEILPAIGDKKVKGYKKVSVLRREQENEVEFITIMLFDSIQSIKDFAGEDYEKAYIPDKARAVLSRFDQRAQHYQVLDEFSY